MTQEEFFQNAAISALQSVIEAKDGIIASLASKSAVRLAETPTEEVFGRE